MNYEVETIVNAILSVLLLRVDLLRKLTSLFQIRCHHGTGLFKSFVQFFIGLLLQGNGVVQLVDQLELQALHSNNLLFFLLPDSIFIQTGIVPVLIDVLLLAAGVFGDLDAGDLLLLVDDLLAHAIFLLDADSMVSLFLFILLCHDLGLFGLLVLGQFDGLLDFGFLVDPFTLDQVVFLRYVPLHVLFDLALVDSLNTTTKVNKTLVILTFLNRSSFLRFSPRISVVFFLVSSIFFQVFISSCLRSAMRFASSYASLSNLITDYIDNLTYSLRRFFVSTSAVCLDFKSSVSCFSISAKLSELIM